MLKKYVNFFITGLSSLLPIGVTFYIVYKIFRFIDGFLGRVILKTFGREVIGLGFVLTIVLITLFGMFARNYLIVKLLEFVEKLAMKIPLVQMLYSGLKELTTMLTKEDKTKFTQVVSLKFPNTEVDSIGFITKDTVQFDHGTRVAVFIPTTPNPGNGFLVYVDASDLKLLDMNIENALKAVISMGTISPNEMLSKKTEKEQDS